MESTRSWQRVNKRWKRMCNKTKYYTIHGFIIDEEESTRIHMSYI